MKKAAASADVIAYPHVPKGFISHMLITPSSSPAMRLFMMKEGAVPSNILREQAADVVRIGVNIWGQQHSSIVISELIRSIIQDDPIKMRRLADIFHVNIQEIHHIWVLHGLGDNYIDVLRQYQETLREALYSCADNVFSDFYDDRLFFFSSDPYLLRTAEIRMKQVLTQIHKDDPSITLFSSGGLDTTSDVRKAYLCYKTHLPDAKKIYPDRHWFSLGELEFAETCFELIDQGEDVVDQILSKVQALQANALDWDILHTLEVYLLDTECSITASSQLLHVHQNTIKYRINVIANLLGFRPGKMPDSVKLYQALAIHRLFQG